MMGWYGNAGWMSAGMLFMGLFWVAVLTVAVWAVMRLTRSPEAASSRGQESALQILDRRFAAGQVDAVQYAEAHRVLEGSKADGTRR